MHSENALTVFKPQRKINEAEPLVSNYFHRMQIHHPRIYLLMSTRLLNEQIKDGSWKLFREVAANKVAKGEQLSFTYVAVRKKMKKFNHKYKNNAATSGEVPPPSLHALQAHPHEQQPHHSEGADSE